MYENDVREFFTLGTDLMDKISNLLNPDILPNLSDIKIIGVYA